MADPVKEPKLVLQFISFRDMPPVTTHVPGYNSTISYWDADKHAKLKVEERTNGDVWFHHPNGFRTEVPAWKIDVRVRRPEKLK